MQKKILGLRAVKQTNKQTNNQMAGQILLQGYSLLTPSLEQ